MSRPSARKIAIQENEIEVCFTDTPRLPHYLGVLSVKSKNSKRSHNDSFSDSMSINSFRSKISLKQNNLGLKKSKAKPILPEKEKPVEDKPEESS